MMEYNGYTIKGDGTFGMKLISSVGSGSIPIALRGSYTTSRKAELAIDNYIKVQEKLAVEIAAKEAAIEAAKPEPIKKKKVKKDGEANSTS